MNKTCGDCAFCRIHPAAENDPAVGMCFGTPPLTMLLPAQQAPVSRVAAVGRPQGMAMSLTAVRPAVAVSDAACSVFQDKVKH